MKSGKEYFASYENVPWLDEAALFECVVPSCPARIKVQKSAGTSSPWVTPGVSGCPGTAIISNDEFSAASCYFGVRRKYVCPVTYFVASLSR